MSKIITFFKRLGSSPGSETEAEETKVLPVPAVHIERKAEMIKADDNDTGPDFGKPRGDSSNRRGTINQQLRTAMGYGGRNGVPREPLVSLDLMWGVYRSHSWSRAIIDLIVKTATAVHVRVRPKRPEATGIPDKTKRNMDAVMDFFEDPNLEKESFMDIRKKTILDLLVSDSGCMEKVKDTTGKLAEIYNQESRYIRKNINKHGNLIPNRAYLQYLPENPREPAAEFQKDELIYMIQYPQPGSVYGLSPLESLKQTIAADLFADRHNLEFFQNNAMPSGIVGLGGMKKPALKRFADWWRAQFKGRSHKMAFVGTKPEFLDLTGKNKDMEFMEYARWLLQKVMSCYSMQPIVLGIRDVGTGRLNSVQQIEVFKANAIKPILALESYTYTKEIVQDGLGIYDVVADFDDIDRADVETQANIDKTYVQNAVNTINEVRALKGLGPVPWGDAPFVPGQQTQGGNPIKPVQSQPAVKPSVTAEDKMKDIISMDGEKLFMDFDVDPREMEYLLSSLFNDVA